MSAEGHDGFLKMRIGRCNNVPHLIILYLGITKLWKVTFLLLKGELPHLLSISAQCSGLQCWIICCGQFCKVNCYLSSLICVSHYSIIVITTFIMPSKLNVSSIMEHELQRLLWDCLFYRAFPLTLSLVSVSLCLSRSSSQGGSLQEQQAGRALSHRGTTQECIVCVRKTGQLGQNSAPSSLNRAYGCGNVSYLAPRERTIKIKYNTSRERRYFMR